MAKTKSPHDKTLKPGDMVSDPSGGADYMFGNPSNPSPQRISKVIDIHKQMLSNQDLFAIADKHYHNYMNSRFHARKEGKPMTHAVPYDSFVEQVRQGKLK